MAEKAMAMAVAKRIVFVCLGVTGTQEANRAVIEAVIRTKIDKEVCNASLDQLKINI